MLDCEWEELVEEECGLGSRPYVMTTATATLTELDWSPTDARDSLRDMMSDPVGSNALTLENFQQKIAGEGEPDQQAIRQRVAWPAREVEDTEVFTDRQQTGKKEPLLPDIDTARSTPTRGGEGSTTSVK